MRGQYIIINVTESRKYDIVALMTEQSTTDTPKKRGRKPIGDVVMTPAERQKRRRALLRTEGDKNYLVRLNGLQQEWVEALAQGEGISGTKALQTLLEVSLNRYIGVVHRCERLQEMGASEVDVAAFMQANLFPPLPSIGELELPRPSEN